MINHRKAPSPTEWCGQDFILSIPSYCGKVLSSTRKNPAFSVVKYFIWKEFMEGIVMKFDGRKGFGTILSDDNKRYFFHLNSVANKKYRLISDGVKVIFELSLHHNPESKNEYEAINVIIL